MICRESGGTLSASLDCGEGGAACSNSYDGFGRVIGTSCTYGNGVSFGCSISYDGAGNANGSCSGEGDSCSF